MLFTSLLDIDELMILSYKLPGLNFHKGWHGTDLPTNQCCSLFGLSIHFFEIVIINVLYMECLRKTARLRILFISEIVICIHKITGVNFHFVSVLSFA